MKRRRRDDETAVALHVEPRSQDTVLRLHVFAGPRMSEAMVRPAATRERMDGVRHPTVRRLQR